MVKYVPEDTTVAFAEVPDEITLCINISNCQNNCIGCHSPYLKEDIGQELTPEVLNGLIDKNRGISCVCFMGEGNDIDGLISLAGIVKMRNDYPYKVGIYSGRPAVEDRIYDVFDYVKVGPYIHYFGPLNDMMTNQRMYLVHHGTVSVKEDITYKFWVKWPL